MPVVELSTEIRQRADLPLLFNARGYQTAVEVGTDRGAFARIFAERFRGFLLFCVDTWEPYPGMEWDRRADFLMAVANLAPHAPRVRIVRAKSVDAASLIPGAVDFVYIDAAHDYESVAADIAAWEPRIGESGILAGHDYDEEHGGVMRAVNEHAEATGRTVYITQERDIAPSWYMYKTPPPSLIPCNHPEWIKP